MGRLKAFEIVFDTNKSVFYPSQQVSGKCIVDLRGDIKMKALRIYMRGVAKVHWTESRSTGNRLGAYTEHYNAEIEYFFKRQILFGMDSSKSVFFLGQRVKGKCTLDIKGSVKVRAVRVYMFGVAKVHWTDTDRRTGNRFGAYTKNYRAEIQYLFKRQVVYLGESGDGRDVLSDGHHEFPFSFQLPTGGISTSFEGKYGSVRYWLKAEMEKPWTFNHKTKKAFTVISPIDINRTEYLIPVENSIEKTLCCWCCTSGPISLYARTDRKGYCPGESIAITADFENLSNRTIIPHATLHQTQTFLAGGKSRTRHCKFTIVTGLAIQSGRTANWDAQLLKIPAVSPSIINCCLIRVDYAVRITLQIPGAYNLSVDLPVVIGTVPLRSRPPHYHHVAAPTFDDLTSPSESRVVFYPPAPPYSEVDSNSDIAPPGPPIEPPPTYAECVDGSVDITEDDDGDIMGDTRFTPMYAYVHDYQYQPPPAYSEVDPNPRTITEGASSSNDIR